MTSIESVSTRIIQRVNCIFCGISLSRANRTDEHVLPRWLLREFDLADVEITPTHVEWETGNQSMRGPYPLGNLVEGRVCGKCNGGWMSSLEAEARPLIVALMNLDREVVDLDSDERFVVARWAAKTAYALNLSSNLPQKIPSTHPHLLRRDVESLPPHVVAFGQQHHMTRDLFWLQFSAWPAHGGDVSEVEEYEDRFDSYKISLQLRNLLLLVAHWPDPTAKYALWRGIHIPLWPQRGPVAWMERDEEFPWDDSGEALRAFHMHLGIVPQGSAVLELPRVQAEPRSPRSPRRG